ncbi:hypothetical protein HQ520_05170, partial [bacterium]|nr:hypothetical protein [bacterium]
PYVTYARSLSTPGFQALYFVATWFIDPILFGKLLSLVLYSLTGMLFFLLGRFYGGKWVGLLIALAFLAYPDSFDEFEGGLHRSFMFPLTLLFFYLLTLRRPRFFGWLFALQILVYPISFVLSLGVLMTAFAGRYIRPLSLFRSKVAVAGYIALILSALILVQVRQAQKPSFLGKMATAQQMQNDPAFYEGGGRASYFPIPLLKDFTWHKMYRSREYVLFCSALAFLFLLAQWLKGREVDAIWRPWLILLLASILLFEISKLVMFKLYIPDRYVQYSFWMLGSIQFGLGVAGILMVLRRPLKIAFSVLLLVAVLIDLHGEVGHVHKSSIRHSDPAYPALFEFLRNTPVDTMIAAPPEVADRITAHTHRKTLTRYELSHPWYENWRAMMEERALDYWTAYYTSDPDVFLDFLRKWDIEYFVTTAGYSNILSKKNLDFFYDPLNHRIFELAFSSVHRETVLEASSDAFLVFDRDRHRVYHFPKTWTASPQAHEDLLRLTSVTSPAVAEE